LQAAPTGEHEVIECGLLLRSIGYRGSPVDDVPFDAHRGLIRHQGGRVVGADGQVQTGEYAVGWIKRGPSGVIGTNKKDAADTTAKVLADIADGVVNTPGLNDPDAIIAFYAKRAPAAVTWQGWQAIDAAEKAAGETQARPRVKLVRWADLVTVGTSQLLAGASSG
jgi:ferredoxin--NADP+ reductase